MYTICLSLPLSHLASYLRISFTGLFSGWKVLEQEIQKQRSGKALAGCAAPQGEPNFGARRLPGAWERRPAAGSGRDAQGTGPVPQHLEQIREPSGRPVIKEDDDEDDEWNKLDSFCKKLLTFWGGWQDGQVWNHDDDDDDDGDDYECIRGMRRRKACGPQLRCLVFVELLKSDRGRE